MNAGVKTYLGIYRGVRASLEVLDKLSWTFAKYSISFESKRYFPNSDIRNVAEIEEMLEKEKRDWHHINRKLLTELRNKEVIEAL